MTANLEKSAFIVTGAGSGMGRATAFELAKRGACVTLADVNAQSIAETAEVIRAQGGTCLAVPTNVADEAQVAALVDETTHRFGKLDGAFNNAGIEMHFRRLHELERAEWDKVIEVNLTGIFLCMKHQLRAMLERGGAIVNTSSVFAQVAAPAAVEYVSSKAAVMGLTRSAAVEYGPHNIRVNAILPGTIETPMVMERSMRIPAFAQSIDKIKARHPLGRFGAPEEIGSVVAWLLSSDASFVNGVCLPVDGGYLAN
jgi:NAD(P)-dependent dehydrogenase (short-subunit alcohol dehydrogenase family)